MNIGWALSTVLGLTSVFGLYNYARTGEISATVRILYALFGRNAFALSLAWVTFACATGYGGESLFILQFTCSAKFLKFSLFYIFVLIVLLKFQELFRHC